jgi:hypothetical protein
VKAYVEIPTPDIALIQNRSDGEVLHALVMCSIGLNKQQSMYFIIDDNLIDPEERDRMIRDRMNIDERVESWLEANDYTFRLLDKMEIEAR